MEGVDVSTQTAGHAGDAPLGRFAPTREFWRGRRVLVTGHTGFKGSWLTLWLKDLGAVVSGYALAPDTEPSMFRLLDLHSACEHTVGDVCDAESLAACVRRAQPEVVIHLAAQALVRRSYAEPLRTYATNVMGTANLLEACRHTPSVRAIVVVTTDKCYENREWVYAYRETDRLGGRDPYSNSKACAELVTDAYRRSFFEAGGEVKCAVASARAGNVFGGGDWSADRLLPDAARAFAAGRQVVIRSPDSIRPWQHVMDPLGGYLALARALVEHGPAAGTAFNFGPEVHQALTVRSVIDAFTAAWNASGSGGTPASWRHEPQVGAPHEARALMLDPTLARARLGWLPGIPFHRAVDLTAAWYRLAAAGNAANLLRLTHEQIAACSPSLR